MLEAIAQSASCPNEAPKLGGAYQAVDCDGGGGSGGPGGGGGGGGFTPALQFNHARNSMYLMIGLGLGV